jgi:hypothetical protein
MGYGLSMDGRSTFEALVEREGQLARRPYSSYCFLLAMDADDEALRFLSRYARDVDDVTGEAIAFIALVDRINLDGTFRPNPRWSDQTPGAQLGVDLEATYEIFEDRSTRVEDAFGGWRSRWQISGRKSVDFARACEVSLAELPCLVIFDAETFLRDEEGGGLLVPLDSYEGRAFEIVRNACSDFYDQNHAHPLLVS